MEEAAAGSGGLGPLDAGIFYDGGAGGCVEDPPFMSGKPFGAGERFPPVDWNAQEAGPDAGVVAVG